MPDEAPCEQLEPLRPADAPEATVGPDEPRRVVTPMRLLLLGVGLLLIAAAVWTILGNRAQLDHALRAIADAPWYLVVIVIALPIVNWLCTGLTVWILTERYARVPFFEMLALIGSAWLFNMLPLRLGMIGRVTYHKKYHGMRVRDCAKVMMQALICSAIALGILMLSVMLAGVWRRFGADTPAVAGSVRDWAVMMGFVVVPPVLVLGVVISVMKRRSNGGREASITAVARASGGLDSAAWRWPAALLARYVDMIVWFVRYAIVFTLIGYPLSAYSAAGVTVTAQAAMVTPVQFGLREWMVGMTTAAVSEVGRTTPEKGAETDRPTARVSPKQVLRDAAPGLVGDACMRAAELAIVIPAGLISTLWVFRSMRTRQGIRK